MILAKQISLVDQRLLFRAMISFGLAGVITWIFILAAPVYVSDEQMYLSCAIAGGKWMIQILMSVLFLGELRWKFLERIGATCFLGSVFLIPYSVLSFYFGFDWPWFFIASIAAAVITMILLYYKSVVNTGLQLKWWYGWIFCLLLAITLQITVVFRIF